MPSLKTLPMFPLGSVLLPGSALPLHVFEPRYRALVRDCLEGEREFGVVLIARGNEVGGGDLRNDVGVCARIVQVAALEDGRFAVICLGAERIRVLRWLPDDPYPRADVSEWPDSDDVAYQGLLPLATRVRSLAALARELGDPAGDPTQDLPEQLIECSYALADLAPLGPVDRLRLLCCEGPRDRLNLLTSLTEDLEPLLRFRLGDGPSTSNPPEAW